MLQAAVSQRLVVQAVVGEGQLRQRDHALHDLRTQQAQPRTAQIQDGHSREVGTRQHAANDKIEPKRLSVESFRRRLGVHRVYDVSNGDLFVVNESDETETTSSSEVSAPNTSSQPAHTHPRTTHSCREATQGIAGD